MISLKISDLRKKAGITQAELANQLGVTYQAVSKWENGHSYPDLDTLAAVAGYFRVSVDEVMGIKRQPEIINKKETGTFWDNKLHYLEKTREDLWNDDYLEFLVKSVWNIKKPIDVIDFGCGYGYLGIKLLQLLPNGSSYSGIDKSEELINKAVEIFEGSGFNTSFAVSDVFEYKSGNKYDMAICQAFLRHLSNPIKALEIMTDSVRVGGRVVCIEINRVFEETGYFNSAIGYSPFTTVNVMETKWLKEYENGGRDYAFGIKAPSYFYNLGLCDIDVRFNDKITFLSNDLPSEIVKEAFRNLKDTRGWSPEEIQNKVSNLKIELRNCGIDREKIDNYLDNVLNNANSLNDIEDETVLYLRGLIITSGIK